MFQFQSIYTGSIGYLNIIMIIVVIVLIDDADAERMRIAKSAIIDPGHIQVSGKTKITFCF